MIRPRLTEEEAWAVMEAKGEITAQDAAVKFGLSRATVYNFWHGLQRPYLLEKLNKERGVPRIKRKQREAQAAVVKARLSDVYVRQVIAGISRFHTYQGVNNTSALVLSRDDVGLVLSVPYMLEELLELRDLTGRNAPIKDA